MNGSESSSRSETVSQFSPSVGTDARSSVPTATWKCSSRTTGRNRCTKKQFGRWFFAHAVSRAGDAFNAVRLVILVFQRTGSGIGVAGTVAVEVESLLLFALIVGVLVDPLFAGRSSPMMTLGSVRLDRLHNCRSAWLADMRSTPERARRTLESGGSRGADPGRA
jgi:hypothetical protein